MLIYILTYLFIPIEQSYDDLSHNSQFPIPILQFAHGLQSQSLLTQFPFHVLLIQHSAEQIIQRYPIAPKQNNIVSVNL
jgi:hypothetical protein